MLAGPPAAITLQGLGLQRGGTWLFRGLDVALPRGKFIAVTGPSGIGKSSLLACLAGMLKPTEGAITYCCAAGCDHGVTQFQPRIGMVFQNGLLSENSTLLANVLCGRLSRYPWWRTLFGFPKRDRAEAYRWLGELGVARYAHRRVSEISGGEAQRTAVARAFLQEPEVFLADEPISQLDLPLAERVLQLLSLEAHVRGHTVLCVLHQPDLVEKYADAILGPDPANPGHWSLRSSSAVI